MVENEQENRMQKLLDKKPRSKIKRGKPSVLTELAAIHAEIRRMRERMDSFAGAIGQPLRTNGDHQAIPEGGRVRIVGNFDDAPEVDGREGVALAGSGDANGDWTYTVLVDELNETYVLPGTSLSFLGWTVPAGRMYGEPAFSVTVDREGNGSVSRRSGKSAK
jgi:hypothetical protein